jgi:hypothetical protein
LVEGDEAVASALRELISAWSSIPVAKTNEDRSNGQIGATYTNPLSGGLSRIPESTAA